MQLEVVDNIDALERFRGEWLSFAITLNGQTPFQLPDWLLTWWQHSGSGALRVLIFRERGGLAGVIPLFRHEWRGRRQLTLIGSGISDYLEPAIAPERHREVIEELRRYLTQTPDWDICDWQDLGADTPLAGLARVQDDTPCAEIKLTGSFEDYWTKRGKDLRRNLRRYGERADKVSTTEFAVTADRALVDDLIRLHGDRWRRHGEAGTIASNNSAEFLREVSRQFARADILRLFSLRFHSEIVAISVGFLWRNRLYSYLSAFDPQYEILGFGRKLLYESLRHAYEQHYTAWNFCRGEEPYKFSFGAVSIPKCRLTVTRAGLDTG